jgi:hypothetical protein
MTATDMQEEFLILYDKITNFDAPGYTEVEISRFLTKGQERVFFDTYNPLGNKYKEGFEETEARRKDLGELVKGTTIIVPSTSQTNVLPNGKFYDLPTDCLYVVYEEITTTSTDPCKNNLRIKVKPITTDEYSINKENPFKKPTVKRGAWRLDYQTRKHEIVTDGTYTIASYHIRYIKTLNPIIIGANTIDGVSGPQDCQFNSIIHRRIVDEAVKIATGVTDPQLYQIKTIEQQQGE